METAHMPETALRPTMPKEGSGGSERHVRRMLDELAAHVESLELSFETLADRMMPVVRQSEDVRATAVSVAGEVPEGASQLAIELSASVRRLQRIAQRIDDVRLAVEL